MSDVVSLFKGSLLWVGKTDRPNKCHPREGGDPEVGLKEIKKAGKILKDRTSPVEAISCVLYSAKIVPTVFSEPFDQIGIIPDYAIWTFPFIDMYKSRPFSGSTADGHPRIKL